MKKQMTYIYIIATIGLFLFLADPTVKFNPFSVHFKSLPTLIGAILIVVGISFINYDVRKKAIKETINEVQKEINKIIDSKQ